MKPRVFYAIVWAVLVAGTIMEVFTRSLPTAAVSLIILVIVGIACTKAILIALYYMGLRYEPWTLAVLPIASFIIVALLAITSLLMGSMSSMAGMYGM
jgi:caa(3)-type oxidase subunit IV